MRIVLRNMGRGREDAVYVLDAVGFASESPRVGGPSYWLYAYWGKWEKFDPGDLSALQSQEKYQGPYKVDVIDKVQKLVAQKMGKGYEVQEEYSELPVWPILPYGQNWRDHA